MCQETFYQTFHITASTTLTFLTETFALCVCFMDEKYQSVFFGTKNFRSNKHEAIYMIWKECVLPDFYKFICKQENFSYLNGKNVLHPRIADIVWRFTCENKNNYKKLRENLRKYRNIFQYVYSSVYSAPIATANDTSELRANFK